MKSVFYNKHIVLILSIYMLMVLQLNAQKRYKYNDGPYISQSSDTVSYQWIQNGKLKSGFTTKLDTFRFEVEGLPVVDFTNIGSFYDSTEYVYENVDSVLAISDIHGQYNVLIQLLAAQGVIDSMGNWSYGQGHLVVVGDVFDRGDKVTDCLWLIWNLSIQAKEAGGKVHFLLGNHELMVLHGDIRYVHPKYRYTSGITQTMYPHLFKTGTILGDWIRTRPVTVKINNVAYVHGGFSQKVIEKENDIQALNELFVNDLVPNSGEIEDTTSILNLLYFDNGPLWYREYANPEGFDTVQLNYIMQALDLSNIVVGHTSMPKIMSRNEGRIFLIDSSIKFGKKGEVLVQLNGEFFRGKMDGSLESMEKEKYGVTPFQYVYNLDDQELTMRLDTDLGKLNKRTDEYQKATLTAIHGKEENRKWDIEVRTRGNSRKRLCKNPSLKLDFSKEDLKRSGFTPSDKLKLVLSCSSTNQFKQGLYGEELIYKMYRVVDTLGFRTRLVNVELYENGKEKNVLPGFLVEDPDNFERRSGAEVVTEGKVTGQALLRENYLKMTFFQYLILNTDWGISTRHNIKIIHEPHLQRVESIPYDFDYSGILNLPYAVPAEKLGINIVTAPLYRGRGITREEVALMRDFFNTKRNQLEEIVESSPYLEKKLRKRMKKRIKEFYKVLNNEKKWKSAFLKK